MSYSSSEDSGSEEEVSMAKLEDHLGAARYQLQILREGRTGYSRTRMDKLYWQLNKGVTSMRDVARGHHLIPQNPKE